MKLDTNIRQDWTNVKLGEICEKAAKIKRKEVIPDEEFIYLDIGGIDNHSNRIIDHKIYQWKDAPSRAQQVVKVGDTLFSTVRTYLRNIARVDNLQFENQICSSGFTVIRAINGLADSKFLFDLSLFEGFLKPLNKLQTGTSYPAVRDDDVFSQIIPLPPLPEQRAIVAKIEQLFSDLDNGIANLKKAQKQLKIYRQAVLKKAFEGELTRKWRAEQTDLPSVEELILQIKEEREKHYQKQLDEWKSAAKDWEDGGKEGKKPAKQKKTTELPPLTEDELVELPKLPEKWKWVKTSEIIFPINNGYTPKANYLSQYNGEIPFIKVYNLNLNGTLNFKLNPTFTTKEMHNNNLKRSICYPNDILINIVGPPLGKVSIVPNIFPEWNINQAIVLFRPNNFINSKILSYFHQNPVTIAWLENTSKATAGQFNVKVSTCREIPFPFCSIQEQSQIVCEIETRLAVCDKLETTITESLQKSEALRQSILKKAFEGELLSEKQLEEAHKAPDWEPADKLLERIKTEKEKPGTKKSFSGTPSK